jgi:hypothetical protein
MSNSYYQTNATHKVFRKPGECEIQIKNRSWLAKDKKQNQEYNKLGIASLARLEDASTALD